MTPTDDPTEALRPEVAEALGALERSMGELAEREQQLTAVSAEAPATAPPERSDLVLAPRPPVDADSLDLGLPPAAIAGATAADADLQPNLDLSRLFNDEDDEDDPLVVPPAAPVGLDAAARAARRRRNGRILSWAGALVLVAGAAFWLLPDRGDSKDPVLRDTTTSLETTTTTRVLIDGPTFPTLPSTTLPASPSVTPPPTLTTVKPKPRATTTTPTTAPTTTAAPTTTTTVRPTTTTTTTIPVPCTFAPGDEPDHPCFP